MGEHPNNTEKILELYGIYSDDNRRYDTIIWQFPTALITVNILAINFFLNEPLVLLFIPFANFVLLHSLFKHIYHQRALVKALKQMEKQLREYFCENMVPDFEPKRLIMKLPSAYLVSYTLLVMNVVFILYIGFRLMFS